jgi:hypothetical protein
MFSSLTPLILLLFFCSSSKTCSSRPGSLGLTRRRPAAGIAVETATDRSPGGGQPGGRPLGSIPGGAGSGGPGRDSPSWYQPQTSRSRSGGTIVRQLGHKVRLRVRPRWVAAAPRGVARRPKPPPMDLEPPYVGDPAVSVALAVQRICWKQAVSTLLQKSRTRKTYSTWARRR